MRKPEGPAREALRQLQGTKNRKAKFRCLLRSFISARHDPATHEPPDCASEMETQVNVMLKAEACAETRKCSDANAVSVVVDEDISSLVEAERSFGCPPGTAFTTATIRSNGCQNCKTNSA